VISFIEMSFLVKFPPSFEIASFFEIVIESIMMAFLDQVPFHFANRGFLRNRGLNLEKWSFAVTSSLFPKMARFLEIAIVSKFGVAS